MHTCITHKICLGICTFCHTVCFKALQPEIYICQVWACLTNGDLEADLRESDEAVADAGNSAAGTAWWPCRFGDNMRCVLGMLHICTRLHTYESLCVFTSARGNRGINEYRYPYTYMHIYICIYVLGYTGTVYPYIYVFTYIYMFMYGYM